MIEAALKNYYHTFRKTPKQIFLQAKKKAEAMQNMTAIIYYLGRPYIFVELTESTMCLLGENERLEIQRKSAEFEHLCILFLRSKIFSY